jgi:uncharacterized protein with HEPN domain
MLSLAAVRLLEIVGEAASQVPQGERSRLPSVPWREAIGMRNRLIHAYTAVDHDVVWEVVADDLPVLIATLNEALRAGQA